MSRLKRSTTTYPIPVIIGLALPIIVIGFFYVTYAYRAWFFQDDFGFIGDYSSSIKLNQLIDFTNFGRFLSRNVYWHLCIKYFSQNAQFFYIFNLYIILCSCYLLYKTFRGKGRFVALIAALFYFTLPATIDCYVWLSNSQHILGHFFVFLLVYLFKKNDRDTGMKARLIRTIQLIACLILGFESNIFASMVLSLPIWMTITQSRYGKSKSNYLVLSAGTLLFALFYLKLSRYQVGAYTTSFTFNTLKTNLNYYYNNSYIAALWIISVAIGAAYSLARKKYFISWLFLASGAFFLPFAFLVHQRYNSYGALTHLFFLLGSWFLLVDSGLNKWPKFIMYSGLVLVMFLFSRSLEPSIGYFTESPRGAGQRKQIEYLNDFIFKNPNIKHYCFRSDNIINNSTGVSEWDIPGDWWFLGHGQAFTIFLNNDKTYELMKESSRCDIVFLFKDGRLIEAEGT